VVAARRTARAFLRGRSSETLYDQPLEALLDATVGATRAKMGVDRRREAWGFVDALALALGAGAATALVTQGVPVSLAKTLVVIGDGDDTVLSTWSCTAPRRLRGSLGLWQKGWVLRDRAVRREGGTPCREKHATTRRRVRRFLRYRRSWPPGHSARSGRAVECSKYLDAATRAVVAGWMRAACWLFRNAGHER
jgi:hypothetical protein